MAYIKLGNPGDYFGSLKLGIHLTYGNAQFVDDDLLHSILQNFLLTGFFIIIDEDEFNNIKIDRGALRGIPLQFVGVNNQIIVEPVIDIVSVEPEIADTGDRYIIWKNPTGENWLNYRNYIATFNGSIWEYSQPKDGWTIPVLNLGIAVRYSGTYPSGVWGITDDRLAELRNVIVDNTNQTPTPVENFATRDYVDAVIDAEASQRAEADKNLLALIQNIQPSGGTRIASEITIEDTGNYFIATDVEMALQELAADLRGTKQTVDQLVSSYSSLNQLVQQLIGSGSTGQAFITQAIIFLDTDKISFAHQKGRVPVWNLYEYTPDGNTQVTPNSVLNSVIAQPYRVTFNDIRFEFPKKYNLVLIIG